MPQHARPPANEYLRLAPEVRDALAAGRPVVALESTVIAHGLPRPTNLTVARAMEAAVRAAGAVPATIALLDGQIVIGLSDAELERLATTTEPVAKASRQRVGRCPGAENAGRHDRRGHAGMRGAGGDSRLRHRRHRWGTSWRGAELRYLG